MDKKLVYIFVILIVGLVVVSGCEKYVGKKIVDEVIKNDNVALSKDVKKEDQLRTVDTLRDVDDEDLSSVWINPPMGYIERDEPDEVEYQEGWPINIEGSAWEEDDGMHHLWIGMLSPVIEDLESDGDKELVVLTQTRPRRLYILEHNGEIRSNIDLDCSVDARYFPSIINLYDNLNKEIIILCFGEDNPKMLVFNNNGNLIREIDLQYRWNGPLYDAAVLEDINRDGSIEIIYGGWRSGRDNPGSYLVVLNSEGEILDGFPVQLENVQYSTPNTPAIGNLDDDGDLEIVVISHRNRGEVLSNIRTYDSNGELLWSQEIESIVNNDPVIGDLDNDGYNEIIFASEIGIHILNRFGDYILNLELGDPSPTSQVALGDLDEDDDLEIIFGYDYNLYAIHHDGDEIFSYETDWFAHHPPLIGDINGDNSLDIIFNSDNDIYALNSEGELLDDFPIEIDTIAYSSPSIDDIDDDGDVELITSSTWLYPNVERGIIHVWDLEGEYDSSKMPWKIYQHDTQHTGRYESIKYTFSCDDEYFMTWYNDGEIIRQDDYNILEDECEGFRCLSNNNEISPACFTEERCYEVCTGSNLCLDIDEWQEICEEQIEEEGREPYCGNGIKEGTERCDGDDWGRIRDCRDLGYDGGRLRCIEPDERRERGLIRCRFDTSQCYYEEDEGEEEGELMQAEISSEIIEEREPVININLEYSVTNNQVLLEWDNIINQDFEITASSIITITGNAIKEESFFSNIINSIKNLFKPKAKGIRIGGNLYKIYKSIDINNPKQELIVEGNKEYFNCNVKCEYNYVEDEEGSYYYSVEINGKVFSVGPVEIVKEVMPSKKLTLTKPLLD